MSLSLRCQRHACFLLAAGAAAGLAAAFNAPLAAILFVIEETRKQFRYTLRSYTAVIIASTASAVGMELVGGTAPQLKLDNAEMPLSMLPAFLVLGVFLLAVLGCWSALVLEVHPAWTVRAAYLASGAMEALAGGYL